MVLDGGQRGVQVTWHVQRIVWRYSERTNVTQSTTAPCCGAADGGGRIWYTVSSRRRWKGDFMTWRSCVLLAILNPLGVVKDSAAATAMDVSGDCYGNTH